MGKIPARFFSNSAVVWEVKTVGPSEIDLALCTFGPDVHRARSISLMLAHYSTSVEIFKNIAY